MNVIEQPKDLDEVARTAMKEVGEAAKRATGALNRLESVLPEEMKHEGALARGPRPTPVPVSARKAHRRRVAASRRANRR